MGRSVGGSNAPGITAEMEMPRSQDANPAYLLAADTRTC